MSQRCEEGCVGPLIPAEVNPTFTRRGSRVEVTIYHVPAEVCETCGREFLDPETSRRIDEILEPFHGRGSQVPGLPPAKVLVEFPDVMALKQAA